VEPASAKVEFIEFSGTNQTENVMRSLVAAMALISLFPLLAHGQSSGQSRPPVKDSLQWIADNMPPQYSMIGIQVAQQIPSDCSSITME
jgi:hypothetical protein